MNYVSLELRKYLVQWISFIGLLLLRAFSSELFAGGAPPGPYCLLEFLREKFATQTVTPDGPCPRREQATSKTTRANQGLQRGLEQEKTLGGKQEDEPSGHCPESASRVEAAAEEYRKRVAAHEARKTIRRHRGPCWQCCERTFQHGRMPKCRKARSLQKRMPACCACTCAHGHSTLQWTRQRIRS